MIVPAALDWDKDGDVDLVVGQEDGRVALVENTGKVIDGMPQIKSSSPSLSQSKLYGVTSTPNLTSSAC